MAKRAVANVVQQNGDLGGFFFGIRDFDALAAQNLYGFLHKVHGAQGVVKAGVVGAGVDQVAESELADAPQPLKVRVLDQVKNSFRRKRNKTVDRIVKKFELVGRGNGRHRNSLNTQT